MSTKKVAIPSTAPGGLDASIGMHFGHCDMYTLVDVDEGAIQSVNTLESIPHVHGGCMAPVQHLQSHGVNVLLAGGMGMRPLMGFHQVGIEVFHAGNTGTVGQAVEAFIQNKLTPFDERNTCGGGH